MDVSKVKTAIETAQKELNTVTDAEFQARRLKGLRPLTLAAGALELAAKHVASANERTKDAPAAPPAPAKAAKAAK